MMLFVVVRHDVKSMRINPESCPSFAKHAQEAAKSGVKLVAHRIRWGVGKDLGRAFWDGPLKVSIPSVGKVASDSKSRGVHVSKGSHKKQGYACRKTGAAANKRVLKGRVVAKFTKRVKKQA